MKRVLLLLAFFGVTAAIAQHVGSEADLKGIQENANKFSKNVMAGNAHALAHHYTGDAKLFPPGSEIISGHNAIEAYWKPAPGVVITHHKITPEKIVVEGETAYDYGYYEGTTQTKNGGETHWRGKYVVVWKKVKGNWLMHLDSWSRIDDK